MKTTTELQACLVFDETVPKMGKIVILLLPLLLASPAAQFAHFLTDDELLLSAVLSC